MKERRSIMPAAGGVALSRDEREEGWRRIQLHMRNGFKARERAPFLPNMRWLSEAWGFRSFAPTLAASLAVVVAVTGMGAGMSSAGTALPGDILYPVKVSMMENVIAGFNMHPYARGTWERKRALRRLEEAEMLASRDALDVEKTAMILRHFQDHVREATLRADELQAAGEHEAAANMVTELESTLSAHGMLLRAVEQTLPQTTSGTKLLLQPIIEDIERAAMDAVESRDTIERDLVSAKGMKALQGVAKVSVDEASRALRELTGLSGERKSGMPPELSGSVEDRLVFAGRLLRHAVRYLPVKPEHAYDLSLMAHRSLEEVRLLLRIDPAAASSNPSQD